MAPDESAVLLPGRVNGAEAGRPPLHSCDTLRFADTDLNGHVTHPVFASLFQNGRAQLLADPARRLSPPGMRWVTRRLTIDYLGELFWPGTVEIRTHVASLGSSSIHFDQSLLHGTQTKAAAHAVMVLMDIGTGRSVAIPAAMRQVLCSLTRGTP
jgi:acyl-CoA thioester hydrolase